MARNRSFKKTQRARPATAPVRRQAPKPTEPKPFHFQTDARSKLHPKPQAPAYKSISEMVMQYQNHVPERFHTKRTNGGPAPASHAEKLTLTEPKPFHFATDSLAKRTVKSSAELEQEALKAHGKFKARKFNARIAQSSGDLGVPKIPKKQPTQAVEFKLHTATVSKRRDSTTEISSAENSSATATASGTTFKAKPVNKRILHAPAFVVKRSHESLTNPHSPNLATKARAKAWPAPQPKPETPIKPFKARPIMEVSSKGIAGAGAGAAEPRPLTEPQPFKLAGASRHEQAVQRQKQLQKQAEQEAERQRQFKARPIPAAVEDKAAAFNPAPSAARLTEPKPFNLASNDKHTIAQQEFRRQQEAEEAKAARQRQFRARPLPQTTFEHGFVPAKSSKPLTEVVVGELSTDRRAEERAEFEYALKQRQEAASKAREEAKKENKARTQAEIAELRRQMVFKAKAAPHRRPMQAKPSAKPLTVPHTPRFHGRSSQSKENNAVV